MNVISEIQRINQLELSKGLTHTSASWHTKYANSAWINVGSLPLHLTEGDIICIFSQYGEIDDIHLVRDTDTGKSRGFAFVKYEDARSCVLAVDNLCGCVVLGRTLRVDHVERYRLPKHVQEREDASGENATDDNNNNNNFEAGHAYKGQELASEYDIHAGQDLFAAPKSEKGDDYYLDKDHQNRGGEEDVKDDSKAERRRRKEERAQKRREKEEHRRRKEERKRRKHSGRSGKEKRRRSRSRSYSNDE